MMTKEGHVSVVADDKNLRGQAPVWDHGRGRLIWTDPDAATVYQLMPGTGARAAISKGLTVTSIVLHKSRGVVFAGAGGLTLWNGPGDARTIIAEHAGDKLIFASAAADTKGRLYAATAYWTAAGMLRPGKLYLIETNGKARLVDEGAPMSMGLAMSADDKHLYHADGGRRIWSYEVDKVTGSLKNKKLFVKVPDEEGIPAGMAIDADGHVWSAQWFAGEVVRYDTHGRVERRIPVPARQVAGVAFGGDTLKDLYITTGSKPWKPGTPPPGYDANNGALGGGLYRIRVNTQGRPPHLAGIL